MTTWKQIPDYFKVVKPLARLKTIVANPQNKEFTALLKPFVSRDNENRPALTGIFFDKKNKAVVATDANIFAYYKSSSIKTSGIYLPGSAQIVKEQYPDYPVVIPGDDSTWFKVDLIKMKCYLQVAKLLGNGYTKQVRFMWENTLIGFNADYAITCVDFWLKQGHTIVDLGIRTANRGVVFLLNKRQPIASQTFTLLMPMLVPDEEPEYKYTGAYDVDFGYRLDGIFQFESNKLVKKAASEEITPLTATPKTFSGNLSVADAQRVASIIKKRNPVPILDYALVDSHGDLKITDFKQYLVIKNTGLQAGFYRKAGNVILLDENVSYDPDDYPPVENNHDVETITATGTKTDSLSLRIRIATAKLKLLKL